MSPEQTTCDYTAELVLLILSKLIRTASIQEVQACTFLVASFAGWTQRLGFSNQNRPAPQLPDRRCSFYYGFKWLAVANFLDDHQKWKKSSSPNSRTNTYPSSGGDPRSFNS